MLQKTSIATCQCGCGKHTPIAPETRPRRGWVKGQPMPYFPHHSKNRWPVSDGVTKRCRGCLEDLPVAQFWTNRKTKDLLQARCKDCSKTAVYSYRTQSEGKVRVARTRFKTALSYYRLTEVEYDKMLVEQDGRCAICQQPERMLDRSGYTRRLSVDHCHKTGKVRGLLCSHCNHALGKFNDDPAILHAAIRYLARG